MFYSSVTLTAVGVRRTRHCCCPSNICVLGPGLRVAFACPGFQPWQCALWQWSHFFSSWGPVLFRNRQYISIMENRVKDNKYRFIKSMSFGDSDSSPRSAIYMWPWKSFAFLLFFFLTWPLKYLYIMPKIHVLNITHIVHHSMQWNEAPFHFTSLYFLFLVAPTQQFLVCLWRCFLCRYAQSYT